MDEQRRTGMRSAVSDWLYDKGPGRYYQPAYAHIAAAIGIEEGAFLDVGCGPGWLSIRVGEGHPQLDAIGIDLSPRMVAAANRHKRQRLNVTFREMDATNILYPEATFHAAAAVQSAHHWSDSAAVLAEVHRVMCPGAFFFIYEADKDGDAVPDAWIQRAGAWPPDAIVRMGWRRFGMNEEEWTALKALVRTSPFGGGEEGRHGFYRRLVLTR